MTIRRNENKIEEEGPEVLILKNYKNDAGFYAIPKEKWQSLSDTDRRFVKSFNGKLRRELENTNSNRSISPKRGNVVIENENNGHGDESPTKKLRTVSFKDDIEAQTLRESDKEITNKRAVLSFSVKDK